VTNLLGSQLTIQIRVLRLEGPKEFQSNSLTKCILFSNSYRASCGLPYLFVKYEARLR
jgi:hypothetical protein